jgi:hypothetical protein
MSTSLPDSSGASRYRTVRGFLAGLSLALCLLASALWIRSVSVMDQLRSADPTRQTTFVCANGELCVERVTAMIPDFEPGLSFAHAFASQYRPSVTWQFAGFGGGHAEFPTLDGPIQTDSFMIPLWLVVVLLAILPVLRWGGKGVGSTPVSEPLAVATRGSLEEAKGRTAASPLAA